MKLTQEKIRLSKAVPGYTGIGTIYTNEDGSEFAIICADAGILQRTLLALVKPEEIDPSKFQPATIIPAQ